MGWKIRTAWIPLLAGLALGVGGAAQATVIPATDAVFAGAIQPDGSIADVTTLMSFTTAVGTVSNLVGAVSVVSVTGGTDLNRNAWGQNGSEIDGAASMVGLDVSHGAVNVNVANFFFGQTVSGTPGDGNDFFLVDVGSNDNIRVRPIDAAGNVIGNYNVAFSSTDFVALPTASGNFDATINQNAGSPLNSGTNLNNLALRILAFDLADFVGTGPLTHVAGLQVDGRGSFDPVAVGFTGAQVPEPGLAVLLLGGLAAIAIRRR